MPRFVAMLGAAVGLVAGSVLRVRRAEVEARLRARGIGDPTRVASAMYVQLGHGLVELLSLVFPGTSAAPVRLTPRAEAALRDLVASGGRAVIASAHTGSWDVLACAMASRVRLSVLTKRLSVSLLDRLWHRVRSRRGIELLSGAGSIGSALAALSRGHAVGAMIDQAPTRGVRHPFLGQDALHDSTAAVLAHRANCPLIVAFSWREAGGHVLDVPLVLHPEGSARTFVPSATRRASTALEELVRARPEQWLWLHRRWKGFEKAAPT